MLGVVGVGAFVAWLFLVQMEVEGGRFLVCCSRAVDVKLGVGPAG